MLISVRMPDVCLSFPTYLNVFQNTTPALLIFMKDQLRTEAKQLLSSLDTQVRVACQNQLGTQLADYFRSPRLAVYWFIYA